MIDRRARIRAFILFALVPLVLLSAVMVDLVYFNRPPGGTSPPALVPGTTPIERVIVLMKENHAFDNYFGTYPGADGLPEGLLVEGVAPFHFTSVRTE